MSTLTNTISNRPSSIITAAQHDADKDEASPPESPLTPIGVVLNRFSPVIMEQQARSGDEVDTHLVVSAADSLVEKSARGYGSSFNGPSAECLLGAWISISSPQEGKSDGLRSSKAEDIETDDGVLLAGAEDWEEVSSISASIQPRSRSALSISSYVLKKLVGR